MLAQWEQRPIELANLLNPAFCALLLRDAAVGYQDAGSGGLPLPLAFLVLPVVLHARTRDALPKQTRTLLHSWLQNNTPTQLEVSQRVTRLLPYSREALIFGLQHNVLGLSDEGALVNGMSRLRNPFPGGSEPAECRRKAEFIGRWFAKSGDATQILVIWGLRP